MSDVQTNPELRDDADNGLVNDSLQDEAPGDGHMSLALLLGAGFGLVVAILAGYNASEAFAQCPRSISTSCEPHMGMALFVGVVTFALVMFLAFIIGTIMQTNALVKAIARATLPKDQDVGSYAFDETSQQDIEAEDLDTIQSEPVESNSDESELEPEQSPITFWLYVFILLGIVAAILVWFVASIANLT